MSPINVAFVTACTALVAALVGPFITFKIGKAQINAAVLSANRQKWIETFRDLVAAFCAQAVAASLLRGRIIEDGQILTSLDPQLVHRLEDIMKTFTKLRLMINPTEDDHVSLIQSLNQVLTTLRTAPLNADLEPNLQSAIDRAVSDTQMILKREWIRVKQGY